ncbi:ABC transporter permease [Geodermatophilus sabuli]|uniref:ABC-type nitrate/sulfonate/bicarbonate transport system, permease component n=1 Tax=Geodermatophilus sabuli TaxID=1564158 RepID=A0A285EAU6_9ACTN|nr:ABC transporter permease [Geodermatophilus sabuli]MBB3085486.1 ABC-type nitrate/sulfonate/bicarbonate transport system permease component [Geodermatophilus sabuli]SNX96090.1 ABC-type nitrate/sulfonate/bicarbonate transport system, permease component [Geodermatophilus sabuli]
MTTQQHSTDQPHVPLSAPESEAVEERDAQPAPSTRRERAGLSWPVKVALRLVVPAAILLVWWLVSTSQRMGLYVVDPLTAFDRFVTDFLSADPSRFFLGDATYDHLFPSVGRALAGLAIAIVVGVVVGIVLGISPVLTGLFQPMVHLGRSLPSPALLGVFFFMFGTGDLPKIFLIAFSIVWPILLNTIDGVSSIGQVRAQAAQVFRIPGRDVLFHIVLPGAAPKIFAGIRTSLSLSLILMIISELQKSENGLGYQLIQSQRNFDYAGFWSVLIVLVILGVAFNLIFKFVERRALAWHRGATQQND